MVEKLRAFLKIRHQSPEEGGLTALQHQQRVDTIGRMQPMRRRTEGMRLSLIHI